MTFSFSPDDFTKGLIDDVRARIVAAVSMFWSEGGGNPAIKLTLEDETGKKHDAIYSAGKREALVPTSDYDSFEPAQGKSTASFNENSNAAELFRELRTVGVPNEILKSGSLRRLVGIEAQWKRKNLPGFKDANAPADAKAADRQVLVPTKLYSNTGTAQGNGSVGATTPAPAAGADTGAAVAKVMDTLMKNGGSMAKAALASAIWSGMQAPEETAARTAIVMLINQDPFLKSGPWKYENGIVSLG